jgi:hypothetical protein
MAPSNKQLMPRKGGKERVSNGGMFRGLDGNAECAILPGEVKLPPIEAKPCANQHVLSSVLLSSLVASSPSPGDKIMVWLCQYRCRVFEKVMGRPRHVEVGMITRWLIGVLM